MTATERSIRCTRALALACYRLNTSNRRRAMSDGESRLLFAVGQGAIRTYLVNMNGATHPRRARSREVATWFKETRTGSRRPGLFGFETLCEALGIEPDLQRRRLASLRIGRRGATGLSRHRRRW
jgi:hypothetical protein